MKNFYWFLIKGSFRFLLSASFKKILINSSRDIFSQVFEDFNKNSLLISSAFQRSFFSPSTRMIFHKINLIKKIITIKGRVCVFVSLLLFTLLFTCDFVKINGSYFKLISLINIRRHLVAKFTLALTLYRPRIQMQSIYVTNDWRDKWWK